MKPKRESPRYWGEQLIPNRLIPRFILEGSISRYVWAGNFVEGKIALDVGCGSGYGANYLKSRAARYVTGGDMSPEAISYAGERYKDGDLSFLLLEAERLPFRDNCFEIVLSFEVIEHVEKYREFVVECCRVLRDDGIFICSTPNRQAAASKTDKPLALYHHQEFDAGELRRLLDLYFHDVEMYGMDPQKPGDKTLYKLASILQSKIFAIPKIYLLTNLVTRFVFRRYHLLKLGDADRNIEQVPGTRFQPFLIRDDSPLPGDLIAIGRNKRVA